VDLPELRCVEIVPRHLSLVELESGDCRYPYGGDGEDEPITFCGHPRRPDSSYCAPHFDLSRDPESSAAPVLSTDWLRVIGAI
jgi:GcrA cell cycle regulator